MRAKKGESYTRELHSAAERRGRKRGRASLTKTKAHSAQCGLGESALSEKRSAKTEDVQLSEQTTWQRGKPETELVSALCCRQTRSGLHVGTAEQRGHGPRWRPVACRWRRMTDTHSTHLGVHFYTE